MMATKTTKRMRGAQRVAQLCSGVLALGVGCAGLADEADAPAEPRPVQAAPQDVTGLELAARDLGPDPYEVGSRWYDYDSRTRVLTPKPHVYALRLGERVVTLCEIVSYYDDRGESGVFTLRGVSRGEDEDGAWGESVRQVQLTRNVKAGAVCLSATLEEVGCEEERAALVFRVVPRPLPDAGFTVQEPGLFLRDQYGAPREERLRLAVIEADAVEEVSREDEALAAHPSALSSGALPSHSRVGWLHESAGAMTPRADVHLQVTSSLHAAQWRVVGLERAGEELVIRVELLCQAIKLSDQAPFELSALREVEVRLPLGAAYAGAQVSLCDSAGLPVAAVTHRTETPFAGLWEAHPAFDWFVEQHEGRAAIRLAPGNLLWNWTRADDPDMGGAEPLDLAVMWARFFP